LSSKDFISVTVLCVNYNKLAAPDRENAVTLNVSDGEAGSVGQLDPFGGRGEGRGVMKVEQ